MPDKLKVAVVGVGHLGKEHARVYSQIPDVQLVAVADSNEAQATAVAKRVGTKAVTDYRSLLGEVDAVSVATPTTSHFEIARDFLQAHCHVLVEKPMTNKAETAAELVKIAQANKCKIQVGHIERFNPAFMEIMRRNIRPVYIESLRLSPFRFRSGDVSVILDIMIHDIDIIRALTKSEVDGVDAVGVNLLGENYDIANVRLSFACGCIANVTASRVSLKPVRQIRIFTPDSYISLDYSTMQAKIVTKPAGLNLATLNLQKTIPEKFLGLTFEEIFFGRVLQMENLTMKTYEPLLAELESFVRCIQQDKTPQVSGEDGFKALQIAQMITDDIEKNLQKVDKKLHNPG